MDQIPSRPPLLPYQVAAWQPGVQIIRLSFSVPRPLSRLPSLFLKGEQGHNWSEGLLAVYSSSASASETRNRLPTAAA